MASESKIILELLDQDIQIATAESCTGGLLASAFTKYSGISTIYQTGLVTYSNESKVRYLKVKPETLNKYGAVSHQVCSQMCFHLAKISKADLTIATTGVAGPNGGTPLKPVGLVFAGLYYQKQIYIKKLSFPSNSSRSYIQKGTVKECFQMIKEVIDGL